MKSPRLSSSEIEAHLRNVGDGEEKCSNLIERGMKLLHAVSIQTSRELTLR